MSTDALSDVLSAVHLSGRCFSTSPPNRRGSRKRHRRHRLPDEVTPGAQHAIEYHVVTRGSCWISLVGDTAFEPVRLEEGDIAVIPHGDPHVVSSAPGMRAEPNWDATAGPRTPTHCLSAANRRRGSERHPSDLRLLQLRRASVQSAARTRCRASCGLGVTHRKGHTVCSTNSSVSPPPRRQQTGRQPECSQPAFGTDVRRSDPLHMDQLANNNTGWLAGLRDPLVGRALTLLHARPAHAWTLEELASQAGASRSALADRFTHLVGCPPIQYLTQWRMQNGCQAAGRSRRQGCRSSRMMSATNPKLHSAARSRSLSAGRRANGEQARSKGRLHVFRHSLPLALPRGAHVAPVNRLTLTDVSGF